MPTAPAHAWKRLGALLVQRRIELAPRYRQRTVFAADVGIKWRLLHDIERAKRDSFTPETLAAVEVAYQWQPGSVARVLAGGNPAPAAAPASTAFPPPGLPPLVREHWADEGVRALWALDSLKEPAKLGLVSYYLGARDAATGG